jgi:hypothetical protein
MNTIETLLVLSWLLGSAAIIFIVTNEQRKLKKKDNCQHKEVVECTSKKGTVTKCLDCKSKLKNK